MNEKYLPAPAQFAQYSFTDQLFGKTGDYCFYRQTVHRRGVDNREVTDSHHRHIERTRNGRGGKGHDINNGPERFEPFFILDPEALFLIDDHQAEILERHILLQQSVRTDNDVDIPFFKPLQNFLLLSGAAETGEHLDGNRIIFEPFMERFIMLLGENGGRHEDTDLFAIERRFEGTPQCNLGFAVADIPTDKAIHRL